MLLHLPPLRFHCAGIEPRTVATTALAVRRSNPSARSYPQNKQQVKNQFRGSVTFWYGFEFADPYLLTNGSRFESGSDRIRLLLFSSVTFNIFKFFLLITFNLKSHKKSQDSRNQGSSYYFCLMIEGSGSVPRTNGPGSGRPQNIGYGSATLLKQRKGPPGWDRFCMWVVGGGVHRYGLDQGVGP
jgi:hypothetical protein